MPQVAIVEQIARNLLETLNGISVAAGYDNDVTAERPRPALGNRRRDCFCVLVQGNPERAEDEEDFFHLYWLQPFSIVCHVVESENSDTPIDARLNSIVADVHKALLEDINRGMLAHDTDIGDTMFGELPESLAANQGEAVVPVIVTYRVARNDPYAQTYSS